MPLPGQEFVLLLAMPLIQCNDLRRMTTINLVFCYRLPLSLCFALMARRPRGAQFRLHAFSIGLKPCFVNFLWPTLAVFFLQLLLLSVVFGLYGVELLPGTVG